MLDHAAYQESSHQDAKEQESDGVKAGFQEIEEGYQTPTSEEDKIPPVRLDCPPPPPKKKRIRVLEEGTTVCRKVRPRWFGYEDIELESLFADLILKMSSSASASASGAGDPKKKISSDKKNSTS